MIFNRFKIFMLYKNNISQFLDIVTKMVDDQTASLAPSLYPTMEELEVNPMARTPIPIIPAGTRVNWHGVIKRAIVDIEDTVDNTPDNTPILWEDINYRDGYRIIPYEIIIDKPFMKNEFGWFEGIVYKSKIDNNIYSPLERPEDWEEIQ